MLILYILIALFIAWIWVDYYRLVDIYNKNKLIYLILTFGLGCASVLLVIGVHRAFPEWFMYNPNSTLFDDFLYSCFQIGLLEEVSKLIPFLIVLLLFQREFHEPIDYLAFICVSALGFSAVENVMYFNDYGPTIINGRAILSSVGHMFDTALIAYGIILFKFHPRHNSILYIPLFLLLAAISHGFYDFWLAFDGGWIVTVFYFLITISWFAIILNNALNNSSFFNYKKVVNPTKVALRLLSYYGIVFLSEFLILCVKENIEFAMVDLQISIFTSGFIVIITCSRLSRFKLIQNRWNPFKVEIPFSLTTGDPMGMRSRYFRLSIKGDGYDEATMAPFYNEYVYAYPVSKNRTFIERKRLTHISEIAFLKDDNVFYLMKIFESDENSSYESVVVKPKQNGETMVNDKYPIVAMFDISHLDNWKDPKNDARKLKFREWAYLVKKEGNL